MNRKVLTLLFPKYYGDIENIFYPNNLLLPTITIFVA